MWSNVPSEPSEIKEIVQNLEDEGFMVPVGTPDAGSLICLSYQQINKEGKIITRLTTSDTTGCCGGPLRFLIDREDIGALIESLQKVADTIDEVEARIAPLITKE